MFSVKTALLRQAAHLQTAYVCCFKTQQNMTRNCLIKTSLQANGHAYFYADMIDAIKNNRKPYVDAQADSVCHIQEKKRSARKAAVRMI